MAIGPDGKFRTSRGPSKEGALTSTQRSKRFRQKKKEAALRVVNNTPEDWVPEFPGQRAPFGPGNRAHMSHGANVAEIRTPVAEALKEWVLALPGMEYLREPRNEFAVDDWAHRQARVLLMRSWADGKDVESALTEVTEIEETQENLSPGVIRRYTRAKQVVGTWKALESAERHAQAAADRIGLSPLARVKLGKMARAASADLALIYASEDDTETA